MSEYLGDIGDFLAGSVSVKALEQKQPKNATGKSSGADLDFEDFLTLMVAQFKNQSIDNQADTTEMLNQMVQMSLIQSITDIRELITESTATTTAASMIGQKVTIGQIVGGEPVEKEITVVGTGMVNGEQVLFGDDDKSYNMTDVIAIGKIPSDRSQFIPTKPNGTDENGNSTTQTEEAAGSGNSTSDKI